MIEPVLWGSAVLTVGGSLLQGFGVYLARKYIGIWLRKEAIGKLEKPVELIQTAITIWAKVRGKRVHDAQGRMTGAGDIGASLEIVFHWNNGSTEESLAELRRAVNELRRSMLAQRIEIGQLRSSWQLDIDEYDKREKTVTIGNLSAWCIIWGIILVCIGSIIGTVWG